MASVFSFTEVFNLLEVKLKKRPFSNNFGLQQDQLFLTHWLNSSLGNVLKYSRGPGYLNTGCLFKVQCAILRVLGVWLILSNLLILMKYPNLPVATLKIAPSTFPLDWSWCFEHNVHISGKNSISWWIKIFLFKKELAVPLLYKMFQCWCEKNV